MHFQKFTEPLGFKPKTQKIKLISFTRVNHRPPSLSSIPALLPNSNLISPTHAAKLKNLSLPHTGKIQFCNTTNLQRNQPTQ
ncbi:hypothetical protein NC652_031524 [Populus alba x Populus x berolinensis]|nr:hypothetical protein NC652_031524 [Populus alba x Populus x berolinensis]